MLKACAESQEAGAGQGKNEPFARREAVFDGGLPPLFRWRSCHHNMGIRKGRFWVMLVKSDAKLSKH